MKKKVLFILHIPPPVNGAALVGKFIQESDVIQNSFDADFINLTTSFSLQQIGKGGFGKVRIIVKILINVFKALRKKDYDLCYMTLTAKGTGFYKDFLIVVLLKLFRKSIVYHFHNKGVKNNSANTFNDWLYRFVFKDTKSIVLSASLSTDIDKYVDNHNIYICANGIPDIQLREKKATDRKQSTLCKFLFLSNMMKEKGVIVLLEACKALKDKGLSFECHFIGAWSDITEDYFFEVVNDHQLSDVVFAHGKKYGSEKLEFFKESDVFVFPTFYHNECFPLVLLEAMQQSLPIISTPEGGIGDLVVHGETGILVNQKDVSVLSDSLQLMLDNESLRRAYGIAGRKRYEQLYTLSKFEQRISSVLKIILEGRA